MQTLIEHLQSSEEKIIYRLIEYAKTHGYVKYTSTLIEAWRASVCGLTQSFTHAIKHHGGIPSISIDDDLPNDPIGAFALQSAQNHRARGVPADQFLGLFKYYRQSYVDEINTLQHEDVQGYTNLFHRFCDRVEVMFCNEWLKKDESNLVKEMQEGNRILANEKNQYLTLLESLKEPVFWVDDDLTIRYTNQAGAALMIHQVEPKELRNNDELSKTTMLGKSFPWLNNDLQRMILDQTPSFHSQLILQHEKQQRYHVHISPMQDVSGKYTGLTIIFKDITDLHDAQKAVQESESQLRAFFEGSHDGIAIHELIHDIKGQPVDYKIIEVNQAYTNHTGLPDEVVRGKKGTEVYDSDPPPYLSIFAKVVREGTPETFEVYYKPFKRHYLIKAFASASDQFVTIFSDITQRVHNENNLKQAIDIQRSIMRATPAAIGMINSFEKCSFSWVNDRMCSLLGYSKDELTSCSTEILYTSQDEFSRTSETLREQLTHKPVASTETTWITKDGDHRYVLLNYAPLNPENHDQGIVFTGQDITDTKNLQDDQKRLEQQLLRTQKLESLGVLAGGIAHDFNNILVAILGNADLALSELPKHSAARPYLSDVEKASKRAGDLCRQLLAYSGKGRFVIEKIHLQEVVEEMTNMLEVSIAKNAVLRFRFADNVPPVDADATQLRQIVMNLVINASEAIESRSGIISISTGAMDCTKTYLDTTFINENLTPGTYSYLEVSDTGMGMDKETCDKLFEPFFTTKFAGRGLGMSAALGIVRGHKGAIKVYSEPNKGTTIKILLPAIVDGLDECVQNSTMPQKSWQGEGKILLVDDEETVLAVAKKMLEKIGFEVITAENGQIAVNIYRQQSGDIKAILMDLTMPKLDGEAAFTQMKVINPDANIILSSGYNEQELSERFGGKATAGFLQKPYRINQLREALQTILG